MLMYEIVDNNQYDTEICKYEIHIKDYNARRRKKLTKKGWDFLMNWKDGMQSCIPLKEMKNSYPIEVAEYSKSK